VTPSEAVLTPHSQTHCSAVRSPHTHHMTSWRCGAHIASIPHTVQRVHMPTPRDAEASGCSCLQSSLPAASSHLSHTPQRCPLTAHTSHDIMAVRHQHNICVGSQLQCTKGFQHTCHQWPGNGRAVQALPDPLMQTVLHPKARYTRRVMGKCARMIVGRGRRSPLQPEAAWSKPQACLIPPHQTQN